MLEKRVANRLADARLLVTGSEAGTGTMSVEVAHEVLIRNWERLRSWLNEDREFLLWRQRLSGLLAEWDRAQESDEARIFRIKNENSFLQAESKKNGS